MAAAAATRTRECAICCENFNGSSRKAIACGCEHVACRECTQRYLLESPNDPDCMSCRRPWTPAFIHENFTQIFVSTKLRAHRENVLFDREKSMLPATQELAEQRKKANDLSAVNKQLRKRVAELKISDVMLPTLPSHYILQFAPEERIARLKERVRTEGEIATLNSEIKYNSLMIGHPALFNMAQRIPVPSDAIAAGAPAAPKVRQFIRACPADDCRGFLSTAWKCGMCDVRVCSDCHEIKDADGSDGASEHVCDADAVASARLISRDSRPCPKCAASIYKIDGCDHMFCTACQTPFHWRTGEVMVRNSNPYFYEWMRNQAGHAAPAANGAQAAGADGPEGAPAPDGCTENWYLNYQAISRYDAVVKKYMSSCDWKIREDMTELPQKIAHNVHYVNRYLSSQEDNQELRVRYLIGEIDDAKFKKLLLCSENKRARMGEFSELFTMFNQVSADIGSKVMRAKRTEKIVALATERDELCDFVTATAQGIAKRYKCATFHVSKHTGYRIEQASPASKRASAASSAASTSARHSARDSDSDSDSE